MLNTPHKSVWSLIIAVLLVAGYGCRESERDLDTETISSRDHGLALNVFNDAFKQVHQVALYDSVLNDTGLVQLIDTNCLDTFYTTTGLNVFPTTLVLDYGAGNGPACLDGRYRRGRILANFSTKYTNSMAVITITFDNYWVDQNKVEGTITYTGVGNFAYGVVIENGRVFWEPNEVTNFEVFYDGTLTMEKTMGSSTLDPQDDMFQLTGVGNGRNSRGNTYTANITDPLQMAINCSWLVDGSVRVQPPNLEERNVDYGNGGCDNMAIVNIKGREFELTIPGYND